MKNQSLSQSILQLTTTADQLKGTTKSAEEVSTKLKASIEALQGDVEREKNATERVKKEKEELLVDLEMGQERERALKYVLFPQANRNAALTQFRNQKKGNRSRIEIRGCESFDREDEVRSGQARGNAPVDNGGSSFENLESRIGVRRFLPRSRKFALTASPRRLKNQRGGASTSSKELQSLRREKVSLEVSSLFSRPSRLLLMLLLSGPAQEGSGRTIIAGDSFDGEHRRTGIDSRRTGSDVVEARRTREEQRC